MYFSLISNTQYNKFFVWLQIFTLFRSLQHQKSINLLFFIAFNVIINCYLYIIEFFWGENYEN